MLGDITCDSDGKIDQFIDRRDVKRTLPLHAIIRREPYYLGAFLIGAYQEILGDLHNLFGDTNAVHVSMDDNGEVVLEAVIKGDTVREVLDYVEFEPDRLVRKLRTDASNVAVREGRIGYEEAGRFLEVLRGRAARIHLSGRAGRRSLRGEWRPVHTVPVQIVVLARLVRSAGDKSRWQTPQSL